MSDDDDIYGERDRVWCAERQLMSGTGIFKAIKPREPRPGKKAYAMADA